MAILFSKHNRENEILGLNMRNQRYIRSLNPISAKEIADSKLLTKRMLTRMNIKTPELYKVIRTKNQLKHLNFDLLPKSFVLKPNRGTGGNGIIVFYGRKKGQSAWIRPNGQIMTEKEIRLHIDNILEGRYSMGNVRDTALIEERLKNEKLLAQYSYKGVPDVRVIVYNKIPIMAELRLPTKESDGTANLHAGGIGVGIDIASGITTVAIHRNKHSFVSDVYDIIDSTTDLENNLPLRGIKIPYWDEIMEISVKCQIESGLGYAGVDIAVDREKGPMVFELNARPGLAIQIANLDGLRGRLERVEGIKVRSVKHGIRIAKDVFGGEVEEDIEEISGKQLVNLVEKITVIHKPRTKFKSNKIKIQQKTSTIKALLDTGITTSRIDASLASQIGFADAVKKFNESGVPKKFDTFTEAQEFIDNNSASLTEDNDIIRLAKIVEDGKIRVKPVISISIQLRGVPMRFEAVVSTQSDMIYSVLIGRRELGNFLIDPSKTF